MVDALYGAGSEAAWNVAQTAKLRACPAQSREAIAQAALRFNDRYLQEVIEKYSFCPYARGARLGGQMSRHVVLDPPWPPDAVLALMAQIAADPAQEVSQVIFPLLDIGPGDWRAYVKALDAVMETRDQGRWKGVLASAAFHPEAPYSAASAGALVPLFRRAPDPTIQWTRLDVLRHVSGGNQSSHFMDIRDLSIDEIMQRLAKVRPPLSERIAAANFESAQDLGVPHIEALLAGIAAERGRTYDQILSSPCADQDPTATTE